MAEGYTMGGHGQDRAIVAVLGNDPQAGEIWRAVVTAARRAGPVDMRPGRSQIGLWRAHPFAAVWSPRHLLGHGAPVVLTVFARQRLASPRWREVVEPAPGRFSHHLALHDPAQVDDEVAGWLALAAAAAV